MMLSEGMQGRFFLFGCPRSGTTLLQSILASHTQIASFPETNFFPKLVGQIDERETGCWTNSWWTWRNQMRVKLGIADHRSEYGIGRLNGFLTVMRRDDLREMIPKRAFMMRTVSAVFVRILDRLASEQGKRYWLEKSPRHLGYVDVIERMVPGVKFINILRSGKDNIASLYDMSKKRPEHSLWSRYEDLDRCLATWNNSVRMTRSYMDKKNHFLVKYERLVAEPEAVAKEVCEYLGVSFEPAMLKARAEAAKSLITGGETWKKGVLANIDRGRDYKFDELFDDDQKAYILERLEQVDF